MAASTNRDMENAKGQLSPEGYPQTAPYKWWNWHDNYAAEATPDQKWVQVSGAGRSRFPEGDRDAEAKARARLEGRER
jgi:hypothetical protein